MVPSTLSAETQGGSQATHANLSLEMKGQLLDIVQLQSNMQIFTAKYPKANVVCGIQVDGSSDLQWQCYGPDASKQEIHRALVDFINEEYRYQKQLSAGGLDAATYTLPKNFNFAKFNILRNFIDAAAMAGIVAGVQVTMLLDLATKLCDTGADAAGTPPAPAQLAGAAGAAGGMSGPHVVTSKGHQQLLAPQQEQRMQQQQQQQPDAYPEASSLVSMDSMDTTRDVLSAGMTLGVGSRSGGRKPRFSKEQQASIMESVERNFRLHPSRYTDLVIREMKERYPSLPLTAACVRKIKFRATEAQKAAESQGAAPEQLEQGEQLDPAPATSSAPVAPPRRSRHQQRQQQQQAADEEGLEEEGAAAGTSHRWRQQQQQVLGEQVPAYAEQELAHAEQQQQQRLYDRQPRQGSHPPQQQQEEAYDEGPPSYDDNEQGHEQQQRQQRAGSAGAPFMASGNMLLAAAAAVSAGMPLQPYALGTSAGPAGLGAGPVQLPEAPRLQVLPLDSMQHMVGSGLPDHVVQQAQAQAQLMMRGPAAAAAAAAAGSAGPGFMAPLPGDPLLQCLEAAERLGGASEPSQLKRPRSDAYEASMGMSSYTNGSQSAGGGGGTMPASKRQRMTPEQMSALMDSVRHHIAVNPERYTQLVMRDMKEKYPELELNMGQIRKIKFRSMANNNRTARTHSGSHQGTPAPGYAAAGGFTSSMSQPGMADPTQALLAAAAAGGAPANLALSAAGIGQLADVLSGLQGGAAAGGPGGISLPAVSAALALQLGAAAGAAAGPGALPSDMMMDPGADTPLAMLQQTLQGGGQQS